MQCMFPVSVYVQLEVCAKFLGILPFDTPEGSRCCSGRHRMDQVKGQDAHRMLKIDSELKMEWRNFPIQVVQFTWYLSP